MGIILWLGICWKVVIWDSDGGHGGAVIVGFLLCVRWIFILGGSACRVQTMRMEVLSPLKITKKGLAIWH